MQWSAGYCSVLFTSNGVQCGIINISEKGATVAVAVIVRAIGV